MLDGLSPRERKYVWLFASITFISRLALGLRSPVLQASKLIWDDAYYMFSCARHLALGHGITADGVHATNGIQPLLVFLEVPFFWIVGNDRWLGMRLCFILFATFSAFSVFLAVRIMARLRTRTVESEETPAFSNPVILVAGLWAFSYPLLAEMMNGLETGLYSLLILAVIDRYITIERSPNRSLSHFVVFGAFIGVLILARIDALFFLLGLGLVELIRYRLASIPRIAVMGAVALLVSSPWWVFNYSNFGSIIPISGQAESIGAVDLARNLQDALTRLANISVAAYSLPFAKLSTIIQMLASSLILAIIVNLLIRNQLFRELRGKYDLRPLLPFALASFLLAIVYVVQFHAPYFLDRYFQPIRILWGFCVAVFVAQLAKRSDRAAYKWGRCVAVFGAIVFGVIFYSLNFTAAFPSDLYETALWAQHHPNEIVGMEQSGVAGFTADNVWNLDGKMNPDAMHAMKTGTMAQYIKSQKFAYLADWEPIIHELLDSAHAWTDYTLVDSIQRVRIYQRVEK